MTSQKFCKPFEVIILTETEGERGKGPKSHVDCTWYTGGSKAVKSRRIGIWEERIGDGISVNLGSETKIFQAEVMATAVCVQEMMRRSYENRVILIMIDCQAALAALNSVCINSGVIAAYLDSLTTSQYTI